jgi:hypothetical protein
LGIDAHGHHLAASNEEDSPRTRRTGTRASAKQETNVALLNLSDISTDLNRFDDDQNYQTVPL